MRIIPIKTGTILCNKGLTLTLGRDIDKWVVVPSIAWLIDAPGRKILVDTGMCDTKRARKYHYPGSRQRKNERIDYALRDKGVNTNDIDTVVFTHLHWDHCSNLGLFCKAELIVQEEELRFARDPIPPYRHSYESPEIGLTPSFQDAEFRMVNGDVDLGGGIRLLHTPGHSPGHQSVLVETKNGTYVIAGDAVACFENLEPDKKKNTEFTMIGRYMDIEKAWNSLVKINTVADFVLPGHDDTVFEKDYY